MIGRLDVWKFGWLEAGLEGWKVGRWKGLKVEKLEG